MRIKSVKRMFLFRRISLVIFSGFALWMSCKKSLPPAAASSWNKYASNPVLQKGQIPALDFYALSDCFVLKEKGIYKMWYTEGGLVLPDTVFHNSIGYATSADGIYWNKYPGSPVLDISHSGWDSLGIETVCVLIDSSAPVSAKYKLWYAGQTEKYLKYNIGYAESPDGISWSKSASPVLMVGDSTEWDNGFLEGPAVIKINNEYRMWYTGYDARGRGGVNIGLANSTDGLHWTKHAGNPVFKSGMEAWALQTVQDPAVIYYGGLYHMWYGGTSDVDHYSAQTGYASSTDGIHWTPASLNPVLRRGDITAWDANTASYPSVLIDADTLKMWYTGKSIDPVPASGSYFWEIGYASKLLIKSLPVD